MLCACIGTERVELMRVAIKVDIFGKFSKILEDDHLPFLIIEAFYILELGADRADVSDFLFLPYCHLSHCALGREAYVAQEFPSSCISDAFSKIPFRLRTLLSLFSVFRSC